MFIIKKGYCFFIDGCLTVSAVIFQNFLACKKIHPYNHTSMKTHVNDDGKQSNPGDLSMSPEQCIYLIPASNYYGFTNNRLQVRAC